MLFVVLLVIRAVFGRFLMVRAATQAARLLLGRSYMRAHSPWQMQVQDIGSVVLLQACVSFIGCITRISSKDSDAL
jgi:hypothetical protein